MTPEFNREKYNILCAAFLEMEYEIHSSTWRYKDKITTELLFDSDWNWIMMVIQKVEELDNYYFQIEDKDCYFYDISKFDDTQMNPIIMSDSGLSKKEAVVQSIWEFLNWYKQIENGTRIQS